MPRLEPSFTGTVVGAEALGPSLTPFERIAQWKSAHAQMEELQRRRHLVSFSSQLRTLGFLSHLAGNAPSTRKRPMDDLAEHFLPKASAALCWAR